MKKNLLKHRHLKVRRKIWGSDKRPRLAVFRSGKHIYAQIIDDRSGQTLINETDFNIKKMSKSQKAYEVGKKLAEKALKKKIEEVVFDRGGFLYHGRVLETARGAREGGLKF